MATEDTGELLVELAAMDAVWAEPLLASLRGRSLFLHLFKESLRAVIDRGDHGTRLTLHDQTGDRFELHTGDRSIVFEREPNGARVMIARENFPVSLVPIGLEREFVEAPLASPEIVELARLQVSNAVRMLFRRRD